MLRISNSPDESVVTVKVSSCEPARRSCTRAYFTGDPSSSATTFPRTVAVLMTGGACQNNAQKMMAVIRIKKQTQPPMNADKDGCLGSYRRLSAFIGGCVFPVFTSVQYFQRSFATPDPRANPD